MAYKLENTLTRNFVNCIKHETKYNFLFMEYVHLTKNINNIKKEETKREDKNETCKYEGRNLQKKKKKKSNSEIRTTDVTTKNTKPLGDIIPCKTQRKTRNMKSCKYVPEY